VPNLFTAPWSPLKKRQPKRNSKKKKMKMPNPVGWQTQGGAASRSHRLPEVVGLWQVVPPGQPDYNYVR